MEDGLVDLDGHAVPPQVHVAALVQAESSGDRLKNKNNWCLKVLKSPCKKLLSYLRAPTKSCYEIAPSINLLLKSSY